MFDSFRQQAHAGTGDPGSVSAGPGPGAPLDPWGRPAVQEVRSLEHLELIGTFLRAEGTVDLGRFTRLSDYVNFLGGFFNIRDVTLLSRTGSPTRVSFPELRVRLGDIAIVAQRDEAPSPHNAQMAIIPKQRRRLVVMTTAHIVYGSVYLHEEGSMRAFIDSSDPHFLPMTGVRVRWLTDRRLAGRFAFALLQRSHIIGVAAEGTPISVEGGFLGTHDQRRLASGG